MRYCNGQNTVERKMKVGVSADVGDEKGDV